MYVLYIVMQDNINEWLSTVSDANTFKAKATGHRYMIGNQWRDTDITKSIIFSEPAITELPESVSNIATNG